MAFSGSSLQRMYEVQRTLTSPLPPPHLTPSSVVTSNKTTPEDLCSVAHYNVRNTRNVNIPPTLPHPTPPQNNIPHCGFEKYAFYEPGFRSAGKNMQNFQNKNKQISSMQNCLQTTTEDIHQNDFNAKMIPCWQANVYSAN